MSMYINDNINYPYICNQFVLSAFIPRLLSFVTKKDHLILNTFQDSFAETRYLQKQRSFSHDERSQSFMYTDC